MFMGSPACMFMNGGDTLDVRNRVTEIFVRAARLSYELWTRKTALKVTTFSNIDGYVRFDVDSPKMVAHALFDYDQHDDMLKGRFVRMIVHPMLQAFGTDDGDQYDKGRVLMPAEVWLPNGDKAEPDPETEDTDLIDMEDM